MVRRTRPIACSVCASLMLAAAQAPGQSPDRSAPSQTRVEGRLENEVKAAFVFNFTKYVDWPPSAFQAGGGDPFQVCIIADRPFAESIDRLIAGETVSGRPLTRSVPSSPEAARTCHILFIGRSDADRLGPYLSAVRGAPVLTVGDTSDFITRGGTIAFVMESSRIRFDINVGAARNNGLIISSRLLRVARSVSGGG